MMPYRNQKLRDFAKDAPHCMYCGEHNDGEVVMAHSNLIADGHGMGIKAGDCPCYVCDVCHDVIDGRSSIQYTKATREMMRLGSTYKSIMWLLETGRLVVGNPPYKD